MINYGRQSITDEDISAVRQTLESDFLTQGPKKSAFEQALVNVCQVEFVTAVSSGTAALHLACLALELKPGEWLWTSPISFVASANCARYCGADVDFVDIDARTGCLSKEKLVQKLESTAPEKIPKVLVFVDYAGYPSGLQDIYQVCEQYGIHLIEDACHSLGARYQDFPVGSCRYADMTIFSFHPIKSITTGEGGAITTNSISLHETVSQLASHGITRTDTQYSWEYQMQALGFNYRLSDINAALGVSQLSNLQGFMDRRRELAAMYLEQLEGVKSLTLIHRPQSAFHLMSCLSSDFASLDDGQIFFDYMKENGVALQKHYIPIYKQPYYRSLYGDKPLENAEYFYQAQFTLPIYPTLKDEEVAKISDLVGQYFSK